ncbi:hypothetical protein ACJMK2_023226 [Sinanodonta woodiana]|uniref:Calpain catalytic domain-containing protein n=1 Tax=Sinanodonta woodiana TaxID=1069815 RepID=A0ABD3T3J9_SINWO
MGCGASTETQPQSTNDGQYEDRRSKNNHESHVHSSIDYNHQGYGQYVDNEHGNNQHGRHQPEYNPQINHNEGHMKRGHQNEISRHNEREPTPPPPPVYIDPQPKTEPKWEPDPEPEQEQEQESEPENDPDPEPEQEVKPDPAPVPEPKKKHNLVPTPEPKRDTKRESEPKHVKHPGQNNRKENFDGYELSVEGVRECFVDFRHNGENLDRVYEHYPNTNAGKFVDLEFTLDDAIKDNKEGIEWKRPTEFARAPVLISQGATRCDIGQGSAGTCWFLSMVAVLSDKPDRFEKVVPADGWIPDDGVFHCRFWRFGEWEDVHIDDYLPVINGNTPWGAKSRDDENEMWPSLVEKAFARFHGNYNAIYGGQPGDAYLALTGGVSEYIDFDKELEADSQGSKKKALAMFQRVQNALRTGALLSCEVPEEYDNHKGLVGGHAYSLTGAEEVTKKGGSKIQLIRIRNPWGHTEWKGRWSDGAPEWDTVPSNSVNHAKIDDGEFWMQLDDFIKFFSGLTICSITPDFDKDGSEDTLNHSTCIYGDWNGETAAGFENKIQNPKYLFTVPEDGMDDTGKVPIVLQIIQKIMHRNVDEKFSIRIDLYKVLGENENGSLLVVEELGDANNVYKMEVQMTNRFRVEPGRYMAVPSTMNAREQNEFLIRIFSSCPLSDINDTSSRTIVMACDIDNDAEKNLGSEISFCECYFGRWVHKKNAGGQISHPTHYLNPQYGFTIPKRAGEQTVSFALMQAPKSTLDPIGLRVYPLEGAVPVNQDYLYNNYENCPVNIEGSQGTFMNANCITSIWRLPPGRYLLLLHMNGTTDQNTYALVCRASCNLNIEPKQTGE